MTFISVKRIPARKSAWAMENLKIVQRRKLESKQSDESRHDVLPRMLEGVPGVVLGEPRVPGVPREGRGPGRDGRESIAGDGEPEARGKQP
jgi:hypothetical protein